MWEASFHNCSTGPVSLGLNISPQEVLTLTSICILIRQCLDGWAGNRRTHAGHTKTAAPAVFRLFSAGSLQTRVL